MRRYALILLLLLGCDKEDPLLEAHNEIREARGLQPLELDPRLQEAAQSHADYMNRTGRMTHDGFQGRLAGAGYSIGNENVAMGQTSVSMVLGDWMQSPGHRRAILGGSTHFGGGRSGNAWCVLFGRKQ